MVQPLEDISEREETLVEREHCVRIYVRWRRNRRAGIPPYQHARLRASIAIDRYSLRRLWCWRCLHFRIGCTRRGEFLVVVIEHVLELHPSVIVRGRVVGFPGVESRVCRSSIWKDLVVIFVGRFLRGF
jgi:hypothetical protein